MENNYYSNISNDFYKVSFVTTHSEGLPDKLRQTGALIVMDNVDTKRKSLWFRGRLIASGHGFVTGDQANTATYFIDNIDNIFGAPNGVYQFIDGYTMQNGEKGRSLADRFRDTYTYIENLEEGSNDLWAYAYNTRDYLDKTYAYTLSYIGDTYNTLYTYITNEIEDVYSYFRNEDTKIWSYIEGAYSYMTISYNHLHDYVLEKFEDIDEDILSYYKKSLEYTDEKTQEVHKYVDDFAYKLLDGAPEELDQLKEIGDLLKYMHSQGLGIWENVHDIQNTYVTHFVADDPNGYAYVNPTTYRLDAVEHTGTYTYTYTYGGNSDHGHPDDWINGETGIGEATYTYYTYDYIKHGNLAINSNIINSGPSFDNTQLETLLPLILPPYDYQKPVIYITEEECYRLNNTIIEYSNDIRVPIKLNYNTKDASWIEMYYGSSDIEDLITKINPVPSIEGSYYDNLESAIINGDKTLYTEYMDDRSTDIEFQASVNADGDVKFMEFYMKYGDSLLRYHPVKYNIVDNQHIYQGNIKTINIFEKLHIPVRYKIDIWINGEEMKQYNGYRCNEFITSNFYRSSRIFDSELTDNNLYISIPKKLVDNNNLLGVKIENFDTLISQEILYPTQQAIVYLEEVDRTTVNGVEYIIYNYHPEAYNITQRFRVIVEFDSIYRY